jgi:hypothetical protein
MKEVAAAGRFGKHRVDYRGITGEAAAESIQDMHFLQAIAAATATNAGGSKCKAVGTLASVQPHCC